MIVGGRDVRWLVLRHAGDFGLEKVKGRRAKVATYVGCPSYADPEDAARAWLDTGCIFPLRCRVDGTITYGLATEVAPVFEALDRLRDAEGVPS
jgi:hypothetical protein